MRSYTVFILQEVEGGWVEEGRVQIMHDLKPQFHPAPKGLLNHEKLTSLLEASLAAAKGTASKMDLHEFVMQGSNGEEPSVN